MSFSKKPGKWLPPGKRGQVSLEMSLCLIAVIILFIASARLFVWLNNRFILRQESYENSRSSQPGELVDDSQFPRLDIFGNN